MKLLTIAWSVYVLRYIFLIASVLWPASTSLKMANYLCIIASAVMLVIGTQSIIGKSPTKWPKIVGTIIGLWTIGILVQGMPIISAIISIFAFLSFSYIQMGIQILRQIQSYGIASRLVGWLFILWGIHQADYPLLRPIEWFAPWEFLIGSIFATTIAIGMILIYFERTHKSLHEKEERFNNVIESSQNWIWEVDATGIYTFASNHVMDMIGYA